MADDLTARHPCDYCGTMLDEDDCVESDIPAVNGPMLHSASQCREYVYAAKESYKREVATLRAQLLDDAAKLQEGIALVAAKAHELGATTDQLDKCREAWRRQRLALNDARSFLLGRLTDGPRVLASVEEALSSHDAVADAAPPLRPIRGEKQET